MSDPLVIALTRLCGGKGRAAAARRAEVADQLGVNEQSLYQIVSGVKLSSGRERTVGRELREKLDRHFPGWLTAEDAAQVSAAPNPQDALVQALAVIRGYLIEAHDQESVRAADALRLLALTPDSERAFHNAISALIPTRREDSPLASGGARQLDHAMSPPPEHTGPANPHELGGNNQPDGGEEWKHRGRRIGQSIKPINATTAKSQKIAKERSK